MRKGYQAKKRNSHDRKRKRIVLISAEGRNRTEENYFSGFSNDEVRIVYARGNDTDPIRMARHLKEIIPGYSKNMSDIYKLLSNKTSIAIENAKQLYEYN